MNQDNLINSTITNQPLVYVVEHNPEFHAYIDYSIGFFSNTLMEEGSRYIEEFELQLPDVVKELKIIDENKRCWYPMVTNKSKEGFMIIPEGTRENWGWVVLPTFLDEKKQYKPDLEKAVKFKNIEYLNAIEHSENLTLNFKQKPQLSKK